MFRQTVPDLKWGLAFWLLFPFFYPSSKSGTYNLRLFQKATLFTLDISPMLFIAVGGVK